jgi:hypothetical protein
MTAMAAMMDREPPPDDVLSVVESIGGVGDSDVVAVGVTAVPVGNKAPAGDGVVVVSTGGTELVTVGWSVGDGDGGVVGAGETGGSVGDDGGIGPVGVCVVMTAGVVGAPDIAGDATDGALDAAVGVAEVIVGVEGVVSAVGAPVTVDAAVEGEVVGCTVAEEDADGALVVVGASVVGAVVVASVGVIVVGTPVDGEPVVGVSVVGGEVVGVRVVGVVVGACVGVGVVGTSVGALLGVYVGGLVGGAVAHSVHPDPASPWSDSQLMVVPAGRKRPSSEATVFNLVVEELIVK